jgi:hypothetical protein
MTSLYRFSPPLLLFTGGFLKDLQRVGFTPILLEDNAKIPRPISLPFLSYDSPCIFCVGPWSFHLFLVLLGLASRILYYFPPFPFQFLGFLPFGLAPLDLDLDLPDLASPTQFLYYPLVFLLDMVSNISLWFPLFLLPFSLAPLGLLLNSLVILLQDLNSFLLLSSSFVVGFPGLHLALRFPWILVNPSAYVPSLGLLSICFIFRGQSLNK